MRGHQGALGAGAEPTVAVQPATAKHGAPKIGQLLLQRGVITSGQLAEALLKQRASGKRLGVLLVELGSVDESRIIEALGEQLGLSVVDLRHEGPKPDVVAVVPEAMARRLNAIPLRREGESIQVAVSDPLDRSLLPQLTRATRRPVNLVLAPPSDIRRAIDDAYRTASSEVRPNL